MTVRVHIYPGALEQIEKSAGVGRALLAAANAVAENVRNDGVAVEGIPGDVALPVSTELVDGAALVTIMHPSGEAVQAKHGSLTKAAAEAGLEVRGG